MMMKTIVCLFFFMVAVFAAEYPGNVAEVKQRDPGNHTLGLELKNKVYFTATDRNWDVYEVPGEVLVQFVNSDSGLQMLVGGRAVMLQQWDLGKPTATVESFDWQDRKSWAKVVLKLPNGIRLGLQAARDAIGSAFKKGQVLAFGYREDQPLTVRLNNGDATVVAIIIDPDPPSAAAK